MFSKTKKAGVVLLAVGVFFLAMAILIAFSVGVFAAWVLLIISVFLNTAGIFLLRLEK